MHFRENESGQVYGITFVDHVSKTVFNGSDLGKAYSAKSITERFGQVNRPVRTEKSERAGSLEPKQKQQDISRVTNNQSSLTGNLLETLLEKSQPEYTIGIPRKRKKRKNEVNPLLRN